MTHPGESVVGELHINGQVVVHETHAASERLANVVKHLAELAQGDPRPEAGSITIVAWRAEG